MSVEDALTTLQQLTQGITYLNSTVDPERAAGFLKWFQDGSYGRLGEVLQDFLKKKSEVKVEAYRVEVSRPLGSDIPIVITKSTTVAEAKAMIAQQQGIPVEEQILTTEKGALPDDFKLYSAYHPTTGVTTQRVFLQLVTHNIPILVAGAPMTVPVTIDTTVGQVRELVAAQLGSSARFAASELTELKTPAMNTLYVFYRIGATGQIVQMANSDFVYAKWLELGKPTLLVGRQVVTPVPVKR